MNYQDEGYLIHSAPFGEKDLIVTLLSRQKGVYAGLVRGGQSTKKRSDYQLGNLMVFNWSARLNEHLGSFKCEVKKTFAHLFFNSPKKLNALLASCEVLKSFLPERQAHEDIFLSYNNLLETFVSDKNWLSYYVLWELNLLNSLGYGLALEKCAVTGTKENLTHVSPKTGHVVCYDVAKPYINRLLPLPTFILTGESASRDDILSGLRLTGYFFEKQFQDIKYKTSLSKRDYFIHQL